MPEERAAKLLEGLLFSLHSKTTFSFFKNFPQLFLLLITLFISSCNFSNIDINLSGSRIFSQSLKTTQMEEITGGTVNHPIENGIYSCTFSYSSQSSLSCDNLDNFIFNQASGTFNWVPDYQQEGVYRFEIVSPKGKKSIVVIEVAKKNEAPVLNVEAIVGSIIENGSYTIGFDASDINLDPLTYSYECISGNCAQLQNITINSVTKEFSFNTNFNSAGSYSFVLKATDGELESSAVINFDVLNVNRAPIVTAQDDVSILENQMWFSAIMATEPDGETLSFSCVTCPSGLVVNPTTGVINWQPSWSQAGSYSVEIGVSDGDLLSSTTFTIYVGDVNRAPVLAAIGNKTVNENSLLSFSLSATDADGDSLTYSCGATCPTGMTISGSTVNWTPTYFQSGTHSVTFTVSDGALSDSETISITVNDINRAPVLAAIGNKTVNENTLLNFILSGTDPDGDTLTYSCGATCPSGMTISGNTVNWTPSYSQSGVYSVTFTTSDGSLSDTETISITVNNVNRAPILDAIADKTVQEASLLSIALIATDPDGDTLTYSCGATCPTGMTIDNDTATASWVPDYNQSGSYSVTMVASDGSLSDSKTFIITVTNRNRAPILDAIANQTVNENVLLTFELSGSDPDGDTLTYLCHSCPTGMTVTGTTVEWTPTYSQDGIYTVVLRVTDGSLSASRTITVTVNNVNRAPVLAAIGNKTVNENSLLTFNLAATDADGNALTYSCSANCPSGMTVSGNTVSWTPTYSQAGVYTSVTFTVSDGSLSASESITITVNDVNRAPNLASVSDQTVNENSPITSIDLNDLGDDFDADGDPITYACEYGLGLGSTVLDGVDCSGLSGFSFSALTGVISWTPAYDQSGIYEFKVTGTDGDLSSSRVFIITVNNVNRAPVLASIGDQTVNENTLLTFSLAATDADGDALTYSCTANCPSGMTISGNVVSWTPTYSQSGIYSLVTFTVNDGSLSDSEAMTITVNNVNRAPVLASILNRSAQEFMPISTVNANDGGDDFDADGDSITYSCNYDTVVDGSVGSSNPCTNLTNLSFDPATGVLDWVPVAGSAGTYEFKIEGTDGSLSGNQIFTVTITPSYPLTLTYRTATASESITLPTGTGSYNYKVDWGDGSAIQTVTTNALTTYTYANAGDYVVRIHGSFPRIYSSGLSVADRNKLIAVNDLGIVGLNNLNGAFSGCQKLVSFNSGNGNTAAVTNMGSMFSGNTSLTSITFGAGFSTANVTTMNGMFSGANKLTTLDLSGFNFAKVQDMSLLFYNATALTSITFSSSLNTSAATNMSSMFGKTTALTSLDLSKFNTANVTNMAGMFSGASSLTSLDVSSFNTSKVTDMSNMFSEASSITTLNLSNFDTSKVTNMRAMFNKMTNLIDVNISSFNTSNVTNMGFVFADLPNLESLDITHFDTAKATDMAALFQNIPKLQNLDLTNLNTANVTQMYQMFYKLSGVTELDLSSFNTAKVLNMRNMFSEASSLEQLDLSNFETSLVTDMSYMFYKTSSITSLNVSSFNTANVTDMNNMFASMNNLTSLNLSNFNTIKVQNMSYMFYHASSVTLLNISNFNTANVTDMNNMFNSMTSLTSLNVSNFNTTKVQNMSSMFSEIQVANLNLASFNTAAVTNMSYMFYNASSLTSLDFSSFNTAAVTNMSYMFYNTASLTSLDLSWFNTSAVTNMSYMFQSSTNLASLNLAGWTLRNPLPARTGMFSGTPAGKVVYCLQDPIGNALSVTCTAY